MNLTKLMICAGAMALVGCANPGIVKMSPDTYMLTRTDKGGIFGNASAMKADVIREASEFAEKQGKVAIPVASNEQPLQVGRSFASFEYQFRVGDPSDPEVRRTALIPRPISIERKDTIDITSKERTEDKRPDRYADLLKLDDLHKRGILSDDEFAEQKKRLLAK